jgi:hypothetical protein
MKLKKIVRKFWSDMDAGRWDNLSAYFSKNARIEWPNTQEIFDAEGFKKVQSDYPGCWRVEVKKIMKAGNNVITVVGFFDNALSFHVTSFFRFKSRKIAWLCEYWGEDGRRLWSADDKADDALNFDDTEDIDIVDAVDDGAPDDGDLEKAAESVTVAEMPASVKKSAWTRLFFPDDAV